MENLYRTIKIFEDKNLKLYEDENFYYLKFIPGQELVYGYHFFGKIINIQDLYFTYCFAENSPSGSWYSEIAYISNDRVFFTGSQETKRFPFGQIIAIRKKIN